MVVVVTLCVVLPKGEKVDGVHFSADKNWRKDCVNLDAKMYAVRKL